VTKQACAYALESGSPFVIITNSDYYALYDRRKGLTLDERFVAEFYLTALTEEGLKVLEGLRPGTLR
jgi:hypothetical protein